MPVQERYRRDPEKWREQSRQQRLTLPSEYGLYHGMKSRCYSPTNKDFPRYGKRGIRVCQRWLKSFAAFVADMGPRPSPLHSVERKRNAGNYTPSNCHWALPKAQSRNMRTNRVLTVEGTSQCVSAWAEDLGIARSTIYARLSRGWSPEYALMPVREYGR